MTSSCHRGHRLTDDNVDSRGYCRECSREDSRVRYSRRAVHKASLPRLNLEGEMVDVVPQRLHRARVVACWSLEELSDLIGVSHAVLSDAELTGRARESVLQRWADICGRPVGWFSRPWPAHAISELQGVDNWLATAREAAGLTYKELALEIGSHTANLCRWTSGRDVPQPRTLRRLRAALPGAPWPPNPGPWDLGK